MKTLFYLNKSLKSFFSFVLTALGLILFSGHTPSYGQSTVVDIVVGSADHTTLEAAVIAAGLADDLMGAGPFTVFAPTDAAFAALPAGTLEALLADIPALTNILTYHVVGAKAMSSDLSNGQKLVTLQGKKVTVTIDNGVVLINSAKVTIYDLKADNGVVHVIDAVLIPSNLPATVVDIVVGSPDHTTLKAAVEAAGLVETLQGDGPFTVFAPTDAAFALLPAGTVEALLNDIPALTSILTYHVVGAKAMSSDLINGQKIVTVQGKEVTVIINNDEIFINNIKVTGADLEADNGVVHVIDAVLIPPVDKAAFPIDFESKTDAVWTVFANGAGASDDFMVISNPDKTGNNTSESVLKFKVNDGADPWAGAFSDSYAPVNFTEQSHIVTMMVWKSVISPVGFKLEASTNGGTVTEVKVSNTKTNQWEKITFDLSSVVGYSYNRIVIFPDFPATRTSGTTVYIDNIEFEKTLPATVVEIIVNSPNHTTLEAAVVAAGLVETLQGVGPFTVFAPTDAAFALLPAGTVEALLNDIPALANILTYHVVGAKAMSSDLSNGQKILTVQGQEVIVTINEFGVLINNAKVSVTNLEADNGVVHVIDAVLIPSADVKITETESMGKVITDAYGRSLYFFSKDSKGASLCTEGCLNNWPIFYVELTQIGEGLEAADFGSIDRGGGVMQTTYKGWPLYYFVKDSLPGQTLGEGVIGKWFVAKPDYTIMLTDNQLTGLNGVNYKGDYTPGDELIQYFTDDKGLTLYTFVNDRYNVNKFTKPDFSNNGVWPIYEESEIVLPSVLNKSDFSVIDVYGRNQLTFKGWPLYYFGQDMMVRGINKGVSVPSPGVWPVPVKDMMMAAIPKTVIDIILNSPDHNTLEAAVVAAGLVETLQGDGPFTIFAPTDLAFDALPVGTVELLLADPTGDLTKILLYHVLGASVKSTDLSNGQTATTLQGEDITVTINDNGVFINNAKVAKADIMAENGVVHVIDAVLMPPSTTGISSIFAQEVEFRVFPNPATEYIDVAVKAQKPDSRVSIFRIDGSKINEFIPSENNLRINLKGYTPGMYLITYTSGKNLAIGKFVVK